MQVVSSGDNLHEVSDSIFSEKLKKKKFKKSSVCHLLNLSVPWIVFENILFISPETHMMWILVRTA